MKEKDLYVEFEAQQGIYYVEKEDSSYGPIVSGSYLSKNYLDDFWEKKHRLESSLRQQIIEEKISPIYYYMLMQEIGIGDLASRVGISKRKLKKHFTPQYFKKISIKLLENYAEVFDIPVANFFQTIMQKDDCKETVCINQETTPNPLFVKTKIHLKTN